MRCLLRACLVILTKTDTRNIRPRQALTTVSIYTHFSCSLLTRRPGHCCSSFNIAAMSSPESLPAALQFSQPPASVRSDHAEALAWLKTSIAAIYLAARSSPTQDQPPTLARSAYLNLYSTAHEYTDSTKTAKESPNSSDLYHFLWGQIKTHCSEVRTHLSAAECSEGIDGARRTIEDYLSRWDHFVLLAGLVANVLRSLDRTHIQVMVVAKQKEWCYIQDLHKLVWKEELLQLDSGSTEGDTGSRIASAMAMLQKQTADESGSDEDLVARLLESLQALDAQRKAQVRTLKAFDAKAFFRVGWSGLIASH